MAENQQKMKKEFDLCLEEFRASDNSSTDDDNWDETGRTNEIFHISEPLTDNDKLKNMITYQESDDDETFRELAYLVSEGDDDQMEIDSDEELQITKAIKEEITAKVRTEMGQELGLYENARITNGYDAEDGDSKLKEAIQLMKTYDRVLRKKIKKEKQVKEDRIRCQKQLLVELQNIKPLDGHLESDEQRCNTLKFLALCMPEYPSDKETIKESDEDILMSPIFTTELMDDFIARDARGTDDSVNSEEGEQTAETLQNTINPNPPIKSRKEKAKNFIERNRRLAADACSAISMTDDEKKLLKELLSDLDKINELDLDVMNNPYQIVPMSGSGYTPSIEDSSKLREIDRKLQNLYPSNVFEEVVKDSEKLHSVRSFFTRVDVLSEHNFEIPGDPFLKNQREMREACLKLEEIDMKINLLNNEILHTNDIPKLSESQLNELLYQCTTSHSDDILPLPEDCIISHRSSSDEFDRHNALILQSPKLSPRDLQLLLFEAKKELHIEIDIEKDADQNVEFYNEKKESVSSPQATSRRFLPEINMSGMMSTQVQGGIPMENDNYFRSYESFSISPEIDHNEVDGSASR